MKNIFLKRYLVLIIICCMTLTVFSPNMVNAETIPGSFSFTSPKAMGTYAYNSSLSVSWTTAANALEYKISVRDLTTNTLLSGYDRLSLGNVKTHSIPSSKLTPSRKYRIWVGAYASSTSTTPSNATVEPVYTNSSTYSKISEYVVQGSTVYGSFGYKDNTDASITIDPVWKNDNLTTYSVTGIPKITSVTVHVNAKPLFDSAFNYIRNTKVQVDSQGTQKYLSELISTYDGTWVARHKNWNVNQGLSNHSWGTAIDINASTHTGYVDSTKTPYDPNYLLWVNAFSKAGFYWGNRYSDSMHYETADR